jgi:hypothetical protein
VSTGAQREKDFPLLDRPEVPAEKMRAEFEQSQISKKGKFLCSKRTR